MQEKEAEKKTSRMSAAMTTETRNSNTMNLDSMTSLEIVRAMNREDELVPLAIRGHLEEIARVAEWGKESIRNGGRIFYIGAGTSGRLGVLDASECPPTFGVSPDLVTGLIAGGEKALTRAAEGAEDDREQGGKDLADRGLTSKDLVIGLAASGRTPYVIGGLEYARKTGCRTAAVSCNAGCEMSRAADLGIEVVVGPEILTGSTRLKAGTAQKMILNMISTAVMVGTGKAYQNLMVDVVQSNEKLRGRALHIVMEATGADRKTAEETLALAGGSCKTAITMILADCGREEAESRLEKAGGFVREAVR